MANTPNLDLVKPAGTDHALVSVINANSDKIDAGVGTLSEQIANTINDFGSKTIAGMNTAIEGKLSSMSVGESVSFKVTLTDTDSVFTTSGAHTGIATKSADSRINATLIRSGTSTIGYYCGTKTSNGWVWQELAKNVGIDATSYDYYDRNGWDYAYSQLSTEYYGLIFIRFKNNYRMTCMVQKQSNSWGSMVGVINDDITPYFYSVKGTSSGSVSQLEHAVTTRDVTPATISTGIPGVVAYKVGRMVFMRFYDFKVASGFSAQLPDSLKPATNMYMVLAGSTGTYAGMFTISTAGNAAFNTSDYSKYYYGSGAYISAT